MTDDEIAELSAQVIESLDDEPWATELALVQAAIRAAAPIIERQVRERVARYVGAQLVGDKRGCLRRGDNCPACRALDRATNYLREACTSDDPPTWDERTEYKEHR